MKKSKLALCCLAGLVGMSLTGCSGEEEAGVNETPKAPTNITLANRSVTVTEGASGDRNSVTVRLRLSKAHDSPVKFRYDMVAQNAFAENRYENTSGSDTVPAGEREKELVFTAIGNERHEQDGTVTVNLELEEGNNNVNLIDRSATITIADDDPVPTIDLIVNDVDVREGVGQVDILASLDRPTYREVTATLVFEGLASGNDYSVESNTITFLPDEEVAVTSINIFEDDVIEGSETIDIDITSAQNANLGENTAMQIIIQGDLKLNDTGVTKFYNDGRFDASTPDAEHASQDADFGLDTDSDFNTTNGYAGLFYDKIDGAGNRLPANETGHECVYDNHTGLTWEIKGDYFYHEWSENPTTEEADIENAWAGQYYNNRNGRYMWNIVDPTKNGGTSGGQNDRELRPPVLASMNCMFPDSDHPLHVVGVNQKGCTSDNYEKVINKSALCGFVDWRLPTITELQTLVRYEDDLRGFDTAYFNDTDANEASPGNDDFVYLSATPSVDNEASVWCLEAKTRRVKLCNKTDHHHVRLVRGNQF